MLNRSLSSNMADRLPKTSLTVFQFVQITGYQKPLAKGRILTINFFLARVTQ